MGWERDWMDNAISMMSENNIEHGVIAQSLSLVSNVNLNRLALAPVKFVVGFSSVQFSAV